MKKQLKCFADCLEEQEREDGTKYTSFKLKAITEKNPYYKVLSNVLNGQGSAVTDFDYETLRAFIDHLIEEDFNDLDELEEKAPDLMHEWADANVDIYTKGLTEWLNSNIENVYYLEEAMNEDQPANGFQLLAMAQYCAIREVYNNTLNAIIEFLKTNIKL